MSSKPISLDSYDHHSHSSEEEDVYSEKRVPRKEDCRFLIWRGDGECDEENNTPECGFNGGDCREIKISERTKPLFRFWQNPNPNQKVSVKPKPKSNPNPNPNHVLKYKNKF